MAACNKRQRIEDYARELPPLTLSKTSVPGLVTLIPVLISITSKREVPCFDDEGDKPAWWPDDVLWANPKIFSAMSRKNDEGLKILRKLVHSCYSYHGVEDLLCRLDEMPVSQDEDDLPIEMVPITEDNDDSQGDSDGLVFVCCFCLEEFPSHENVTIHQDVCEKRYQDGNVLGESSTWSEPVSSPMPAETANVPNLSDDLTATGDCIEIWDIPSPVPAVTLGEEDAENSQSSSDPSSTSASPGPSSNSMFVMSGEVCAKLWQEEKSKASAVALPKKRSQPKPVAIIPKLKTRSQKKLEHIMERHSQRQRMIKACKEMKDVPFKGAWWGQVRKRKRPMSPSPHPEGSASKVSFAHMLGLTSKVDAEEKAKEAAKKTQEVDLDCQIISVEGPLSSYTPSSAPEGSNSSVSPRTSRSLISQLSRDSDAGSRRRISFCFVDDEWADKEALEAGRDPLQVSLLTIDFSSPLGERIKKYVKAEGHINLIKDVENYCKTGSDDETYSKLRFRPSDYRVTYRKKCRASSYVHKYKFNREDQEEFQEYLRSGLSSNSRQFQYSLPMCKVLLDRLQKDEITFWTEEKKVTISEEIIFDDDICITQIDIPESKMKKYSQDVRMPNSVGSSHRFAHFIHSHHQQAHHHSSHPNRFVHRHHHHHHHHHHNHRMHPSQFSSHSPNTIGPGQFGPRMQSTSKLQNHSPSSPHVPNIFRNRTSHAPSPPHRQHSPSCRHANQAAQDRPVLAGLLKSQPNVNSQLAAQPQKTIQCARSNMNSKSGLRYEDAVSERTGEFSAQSGNRRKQPMTQLRTDDSDQHSSWPKQSMHNTSNGHQKQRPDSSNNSNTNDWNSGGNPFSQDSNSSKNFVKLSNFEYFNIKKGNLNSSHSVSRTALSEQARQRQHLPSHSSANRSHLHGGQSSTVIRHPQRPAKPLHSHTQISPSVNTNNNFSGMAQKKPSSSGQCHQDGLSRHHNHTSCIKKAPARTLCNDADDDILEVICIDD